MSEPAKFIIWVGLFTAFWITVHHPFFVASLIIGALLYFIYNSPDTQQSILRAAENTLRKTQTKPHEDVMTRSGIERARNKYMEHCGLASEKKPETPENENLTLSKLLLTYQVPILTSYYESIISFFSSE